MSSYFIWIMLIGMLLMMWFVSRRQRAMQEEQKRRTEKGLVPGNWVRTIGGFYGTVVEVDGDVVTLATPLGDESLWNRRSIAGAEEPPFAVTDSQDDQVPDSTEPDAVPDAADAADAAATAAGQAATDAAEAATAEQENHDR
mgnify:FL=1